MALDLPQVTRLLYTAKKAPLKSRRVGDLCPLQGLKSYAVADPG